MSEKKLNLATHWGYTIDIVALPKHDSDTSRVKLPGPMSRMKNVSVSASAERSVTLMGCFSSTEMVGRVGGCNRGRGSVAE